MPELPLKPIAVAVYERLTGDDGAGNGLSDADVFFAGASDVTQKYVAISLPDAPPRETFDTEGWDVILVLRCHTEHAVGDAKPLDAMDLAGSVKASLEAAPLDLGPDHALLHLPTPRVQPTSHTVDEAHDGYDAVLRYDLKTQHLS